MRVLIRADGDRSIGTGHVMRMVALADGIVGAGGSIVFASASLDAGLEARLRARKFEVARRTLLRGSGEDSAWAIELARAQRSDWIVADGYCFEPRFQEAVRDAGIPLLLVDDNAHCASYLSPLVLNQNPFASAGMYPRRGEQTELLLGSEHALLRREFRERAPRTDEACARATKILVTLGGADPTHAGRSIAAALREVRSPDLRAKLLIGPSNPHRDELLRELADPRIELLTAVDDMVPLMEWADLAIAGAGTTTNELCYMGVPSLLVVLAENQVALARALADRGACESLGAHADLASRVVADRIEALCEDQPRRQRMRARGQALVDGRGAERVVAAMRRRQG